MPVPARTSRSIVLSHQTLAAVVIVAIGCIASAQSANPDPGHKQHLSIAAVSFSCPNGFTPERTDSNYQVAYMRSDRENVALFVAVPRPGASDEYVEHLATYLASYLFPQEWAVFAWKRLGPNQKTSTFQIGGGRIHGFNGAQAVMLDYTRLKVNGIDVIAGYMMSAGRDERAGQPPGPGADIRSPAGRSGLAHVIASITGEKFGDIRDAGH